MIRTRLDASRPGPWVYEIDPDYGHLTVCAADATLLGSWEVHDEWDERVVEVTEMMRHGASDCAWGCETLSRRLDKPQALTDAEYTRWRAIQQRLAGMGRIAWSYYYVMEDLPSGDVRIYPEYAQGGWERAIADWTPLDRSVPTFRSDSLRDPHLAVIAHAPADLMWLSAEIIAHSQRAGSTRPLSARRALFGRQ